MHLVCGLQWSIPMQLDFESSCPSLIFIFHLYWWILCQSIRIAETKNQIKTNPKVVPVHISLNLLHFSCWSFLSHSRRNMQLSNVAVLFWKQVKGPERTFHHIQWSAGAEGDINAVLPFTQRILFRKPYGQEITLILNKRMKHLLRCTSTDRKVESFGPNITCKINIINGNMRQANGMYFWIGKIHAKGG